MQKVNSTKPKHKATPFGVIIPVGWSLEMDSFDDDVICVIFTLKNLSCVEKSICFGYGDVEKMKHHVHTDEYIQEIRPMLKEFIDEAVTEYQNHAKVQ